MPDAAKQTIKLFYCYAREDRSFRDEFEKHLSGLKRYYHLGNWHDREILPGQDWEQAIDEQLNSAHFIFLLISPDFMASDYCYGTEMTRALERHAEGSCLVIPILLRPTHWKGTPFGTLQLLPTDARPITRWPDRDDAFEDVVKEVSRAIEVFLASLKTKKDWLDEGISLRNLKHYEEALLAFEQALELDSHYPEAYQEKGSTLHALQRYDEALSAFEQALLLNPNLVPLHIAKGLTLYTLERYEEALSAFEQAIRLDPHVVSAYIDRDKTLRQLGISKEAQEELASQLRQAQQQLATQQKQLEKAQQQRDQALEKLSTFEAAQVQLEREIKNTRGRLTTEQQRTKQLQNELQEMRGRLTTEQQRTEQLEGQLKLPTQLKQSEIQSQPYSVSQLSTTSPTLATGLGKILSDIQKSSPNSQERIVSSVERINSNNTFTISSRFVNKRIQLIIVGKENSYWHFNPAITSDRIFGPPIKLSPGIIVEPNITITIAEGDWLNIVESGQNPQFFLWEGIKIEGNLEMAKSFLTFLQGRGKPTTLES